MDDIDDIEWETCFILGHNRNYRKEKIPSGKENSESQFSTVMEKVGV